jgi:hypothetical protein
MGFKIQIVRLVIVRRALERIFSECPRSSSLEQSEYRVCMEMEVD